VYIDHDGNGTREWRTVIIGGERGGGDVYFAVDVTNPDNPRVLWEHSVIRNLLVYESGSYSFPFSYEDYLKLKNLPLSWSTPYVGRLQFPMEDDFVYNLKQPLDPLNNDPGYT